MSRIFPRTLPLLFTVGLALGHTVQAAPVAILTDVRGAVSVKRAGQALPGMTGLALETGDTVTTGSGSATVFTLAGAPRQLRAGTSYQVGATAAAPGPGQSVWKGVYDGVTQGFATRGKHVAATMRPGTIQALFPPATALLEPRPRFAWSAANIDADAVVDYQLQLKDSLGKTLWHATCHETHLRYPPGAPPLDGIVIWQVTPRVKTAPAQSTAGGAASEAGPRPVPEWASGPVRFSVASVARRAEVNGQQIAIAAALKAEPAEVSLLARAASLRDGGFFVDAANLLEPLDSETSRALLRDLYLQSGQSVQLLALDNAAAPTTAAPLMAADLEAAPRLDLSRVPPDGRRDFVAPDGVFSVDIPGRWGVMATDLVPGASFYQFSYNQWPRTSLVAMPLATLNGKPLLDRLFEAAKKAGSPIVPAEPQPIQFLGRPARRLTWTWTDNTGDYVGESTEFGAGDHMFVASVGGKSLDSDETHALEDLWSTFRPLPGSAAGAGAPQQPGPPLAEIKSSDELSKAFADYIQEMKTAVAVSKEINDAVSKRGQATPGNDDAVFAQLDGAAPASRVRAELAWQCALLAGSRGWEALKAGDDAAAKNWWKRRSDYVAENYSALKGFYESELAITDKRLAELTAGTPPLWTAMSVSVLTDILLDAQASRASDLMSLAHESSDRPTETTMARRILQMRRSELAPSGLIPGADVSGLRLRVLDAIAGVGYAAEASADYDTARSIYRRGIELRANVPATPNDRKIDKCWRDLGALDDLCGVLDDALDADLHGIAELDVLRPGREAQIAATEDKEFKDILTAELWQSYAILYNNIAILQKGKGHYEQAQHYFDLSTKVMEAVPQTGFAGRIRAGTQADTLGNLATLKVDSGDLAGAKVLLEESLKVLRDLGDSGTAAVTLLNLAGLRQEDGDNAGAKRDAESARELFSQTHRLREMLAADGFLGKLELLADRPAAAEAIFDRGLALAKTRNDWQTIATMARGQVRARLDLLGDKGPFTPQQLAPAWEALREAEAAGEKTGASISDINTLITKADIQQKGAANAAAIDTLATAILRQEAVRGTAASDEAYSESQDNYLVYKKIVRLLVHEGRADEAFNYLSRARSKKLQDALRATTLTSPDPAVQRLLDRAAALNTKLAAVRGQLAAEKARPEAERDPARLQNLQNLLASTQAEFFAVSAGIKEKFPAYEKVLAVKPRELKKAQRALPEGALLLQYAPLGDSLYIFVVTRDDLKIYNPAVKPADLMARVREFRGLMDKTGAALVAGGPAATPDEATALTQCSNALYGMLLAPVQAEIDRAKVVAIIPPGELFYLPFHALTRATPTGPRYLIEDKPVAYLAAADVLAVVQTRDDAQWGQGMLALGDPPGANLPAAADEVRAIARVYPDSQALTGAQATKASLLLPSATGRRILHLAAHGVLDPAQPNRSYIQLAAGTGNNGAPDDGKLRLSEVYGLQLDKVDLVTLSACRTALGEGSPDGSEITSLAESFSSAGTPSVLASLWSVEDESTRQLMEAFYKSLASGHGKADALRTAQLSLLGNPATKHPYFWAPFLLLGDWR